MSVFYEAKAAQALESLGLKTARDHLDQAAQQAAAHQWSYTHFLGYLLEGEINERRRRSIEMSLQFARFPYQKRLEDFDYDAQPSIDRRVIDELATGRFCDEGRNLVLLGPPGVGKTHLAIALGVRICELGQRAYFTTAIDMARRLAKANHEHRLHREMNNLVRPSLLVIDEIGYLTLDSTQASLVFQVIAERYEKQQSIVLTSNKAFTDWAQVFAGDAIMASAALDRLLHRATVLNIRGESYRMKSRHQAGQRDEVKPTDSPPNSSTDSPPSPERRSDTAGRTEIGSDTAARRNAASRGPDPGSTPKPGSVETHKIRLKRESKGGR
jgi:DNA replication protein DnaC